MKERKDGSEEEKKCLHPSVTVRQHLKAATPQDM